MPPGPHRAHRHDRGDRGVAALTTAIIFPAVLFMVMLIVQAGLLYHAQQRASAAAHRAAAAAAGVDGDEASGRQAALVFMDGAPIDHPAVSVQRGADEVVATVTGDGPELVPGIHWHVRATAAAPTERFVPENQRN
jgi:Flp pilus assembly protein TadG